ncbi:MAG: hypothetical protein MAG451_02549 [Anaerolineales bacterium]|nr:hypothetical protein [Anaerolineales bacterium]
MEDGKGKMEKGRWKGENGERRPSSILHRPFSIIHSPPSILHSPSSFFRDRWGAVAAQTFLLLPIFVLVVLGGYEILKAMSVKHALHEGTYQAVRYLALNPISSKNPRVWEDVAETLIVQELEDAVGQRQARMVKVQVIPPRRTPPCYYSETFTVRTTLRWYFEVPFARDLPPAVNMREEYRNERFVCN